MGGAGTKRAARAGPTLAGRRPAACKVSGADARGAPLPPHPPINPPTNQPTPPPAADASSPPLDRHLPWVPCTHALILDHRSALLYLNHCQQAAAAGSWAVLEMVLGALVVDMRLAMQACQQAVYPVLEQRWGRTGQMVVQRLLAVRAPAGVHACVRAHTAAARARVQDRGALPTSLGLLPPPPPSTTHTHRSKGSWKRCSLRRWRGGARAARLC